LPTDSLTMVLHRLARTIPEALQDASHMRSVWATLSMRTLGGKVVRGRWGRSLFGGGSSESSSADGVAVFLCCTAFGRVGMRNGHPPVRHPTTGTLRLSKLVVDVRSSGDWQTWMP
jgi:hypothetical protein